MELKGVMTNGLSKNLSERLFVKNKQAIETSRLTRYMPSSQQILDTHSHHSGAWYRQLRRLQWAWQGIDPIDQEEVLARIAHSHHSRSEDAWLDTVTGYHGGNWAYEWVQLGVRYQKQAEKLAPNLAADKLFSAALAFSIAGYPHLKNDNLAAQSQLLAHNAYHDAAQCANYTIKRLEFPYQNRNIVGYLHLSATDKPQPVVIVSAGLDSLQTDMWRLFRDFLAQRNIAMLTIDMPSVGHSSYWALTEDSSRLHQAVLNQLDTLPWVDHYRVGLIGFRFGGNAMIRLSFLEQERLKGCVALGAPVHHIFVTPNKMQKMNKMYLDVLASRLDKSPVDIRSFSGQFMAWSLKVQGFLSSRRTKVPIYALGLEGDPVSPLSDNQLVATFSQGGKAKQIKSKTLIHGYEQSLELSIGWLVERLNE